LSQLSQTTTKASPPFNVFHVTIVPLPNQPMQEIEITFPDDWHCHLRDGQDLAVTVPTAADQFK